MKRREFLILCAAAAAAPQVTTAGTETTQFTPGVVDGLLAEGKTVFVDFYTDWCSTCRAQGRTVEALRAENPAYNKNLEFVKVDWDVYSQSELAQWNNIPRRSTLLVLQGDKEIGRIVAGTRRKDIQALMDAGVAAAQSKNS